MTETPTTERARAERAEAVRLIEGVDAAALHHHTPCGAGSMVWREWGRGPVVVLLHGGFGSWTHWIRNVEPLARHYRVLAADTPGLGESDALPEPVTPADLGRVVAEGIASLVPADEPVHLVGFSFGGLIGGQAALCLGARVRSLTLVGASGLAIRGTEPVTLVRRTPDMSEAEREAAQRHNIMALMLHDERNLDELAFEIQVRNDANARLKSRRFSLGGSLREALAELDTRVGGIWGEFDATAGSTLAARRDLLRELHPGCEFRVLPGAGHWVAYEASEAFNRTLMELIGA